MPELPEVETIARQLDKKLLGQTISSIKQLHKKSLIGDKKKALGKIIKKVYRIGKMVVVDLALHRMVRGSFSRDNLIHLAIHLKMSGQIVLVQSVKSKVESNPSSLKLRRGEDRIVGGHPTSDWVKKLPSSHTRVIITFESGDILYFNDQRVFGWVKVLSNRQLNEMSYVKKLGPEIWDMTHEEFYKSISRRKKAIKLTVMDQHILSGVGNIYANDALWEAFVHPSKPSNKLSKLQARKLKRALEKVLDEGIKYKGATASDQKYVNLDGLGGSYQDHFRTYAREGEPCKRCKTKIVKTKLGGRGTFFCPVCQEYKSDR